ncbi:MAG: DUF2779 domain-containing protein [Chitinophagales bacterium]|nr:DUF2779 domain-containing protein [Saprospiraceae bacterium]MCB9019423.1 DUF2779 domain-containing protein [Chitinophagales bacterium]MCB9312569.1 DUF2779 domain-containing protein [Lewinellaceae bacterium]
MTEKLTISKSLYKAWREHPRLGWWYVRDRERYDWIQAQDGNSVAGAGTGETVEQQVQKLFAGRSMMEIEARPSEWALARKQTQQAIEQGVEVIVQAVLHWEDLLCITDLLVLDHEGRYDLVEVKSKSNIRKDTKAEPVLPELIDDLSFQRLILTRMLGDRFSGRCRLAYVNKNYIFSGELDPLTLILEEDITDDLTPSEEVLQLLKQLRKDVTISNEEFLNTYTYDGCKHTWWYGALPPEDSVWTIPRMSKKLVPVIHTGRTGLAELNHDDLRILGEKQQAFVHCWRQGTETINRETIHSILERLPRPWIFYDYETIQSPIPLLHGTRPNQQVVVQWSMHVQEEEGGAIRHYEDIIQPGEISNERVIRSLAELVHSLGQTGTFFVWHQSFENTRNKEIAIDYPDLADIYVGINERTFDLEKIFTDLLWFDRRFQGSTSIKTILPVLTDVSYDDLNIRKGDIAAGLLRQVVQGDLPTGQDDQIIKDLLAYCERDTWAMVKVIEVIIKKML